MKANHVEVVFTEDCEIFKKGDKHCFVRSTAFSLVSEEKVAKFSTDQDAFFKAEAKEKAKAKADEKKNATIQVETTKTE
jgi:hypothetical protein